MRSSHENFGHSGCLQLPRSPFWWSQSCFVGVIWQQKMAILFWIALFTLGNGRPQAQHSHEQLLKNNELLTGGPLLKKADPTIPLLIETNALSNPIPICFSFPSVVGAGAFFALSCSLAQSQKRSAKARRKISAKKAKAPSAKEKSANSRFFSHPQRKSGFRAQCRSAGGKARDLSKCTVQYVKGTVSPDIGLHFSFWKIN